MDKAGMGMPTHGPRRVLLTGTFDVANYGDLLFPLVAGARLAAEGITAIAVSPTCRRPAYRDAAAPIAVGEMLDPGGTPADAILIGGGYICIAQQATGIPTYAAAGVAEHAYPSLWIGATLAASIRDIPVLWNAPGVPFPFASGQRSSIVAPALAAADYVSVRDRASAALLAEGATPIAVVPDTVLDLPRLWPRERLLRGHAEFLARNGLAAGTRCLALHVRARALADAGALAEAIGAFARRADLVPVLLSLAPELGDDAVVRTLSERLEVPHAVLTDAQALEEIAAAIAGSALYLGGSLHGYITAAAYGVPAVMVSMPAHAKFSGLLEHLGRPHDARRSWPDAIARAEAALYEDVSPIPATVRTALDAHWRTIAEWTGQPDRKRLGREAFLHRYIRAGVHRHGAGWLVAPQLSGGARLT